MRANGFRCIYFEVTGHRKFVHGQQHEQARHYRNELELVLDPHDSPRSGRRAIRSGAISDQRRSACERRTRVRVPSGNIIWTTRFLRKRKKNHLKFAYTVARFVNQAHKCPCPPPLITGGGNPPVVDVPDTCCRSRSEHLSSFPPTPLSRRLSRIFFPQTRCCRRTYTIVVRTLSSTRFPVKHTSSTAHALRKRFQNGRLFKRTVRFKRRNRLSTAEAWRGEWGIADCVKRAPLNYNRTEYATRPPYSRIPPSQAYSAPESYGALLARLG